MKKNTKSTVKTPAPATKILAPAPTPKPAIVPEPIPKPAIAPQVKKPAPAPVTAAAPKPAPAVAKPAAPATTIAATIDVGFGNALYIRGSGPGLSWGKGVPLTNAGSDQWSIALAGVDHPVMFKFLINDTQWSVGVDYEVPPGSSVRFSPVF